MSTKGLWLLVGASLNLFICAAGAGLLSFPYAVKNQGIIITIASTIAIALVSLYTDLIYVAFGQRYCNQMRDGTLEEIIQITLGNHASRLALFTVVIGCFGSVIGFLILIGDVIVPLADAACGDINSSLCEFLTSRGYMIMTFTLVLVLPASSLSSFAHLAFGSALAVGTLITVVASVMYAGFSKAAQDSYELPPNSYAQPSWRIILGLPIAIFALGNHTQVIQIANEVFKKDQIAGENFHKSVILSTVSCVVIYLLTGICGFLAFGSDTEGDVLLNFKIHDKIAAATRSLMAIHIALAVPVVVIPLRTICWHHVEPILLLYYHHHHTNDDEHNNIKQQQQQKLLSTDDSIADLNEKNEEVNNVNLDIKSTGNNMSWMMLIAMSSVIVLPCAGIAVACPQVSIFCCCESIPYHVYTK